ncbi:ENHANCER OF AG-4 protein 2-like, partial [Trifolium medium]|nr:ENHANCER OF AG-4 protein 2-like [Trifolium medium]
ASPPTNEYHSVSQNQLDADEIEERRVGSVQRGPGGSLSGDTEAAVARDAFEGMIETLSRTKESIGRATRLAIDCAKYGIANE